MLFKLLNDLKCPVFLAAHPAGLLTLAAWNVEWLFDGINDPLPVPQMDAAKVSSKIQAVAAVLQEIGGRHHSFCRSGELQNFELGGGKTEWFIQPSDIRN